MGVSLELARRINGAIRSIALNHKAIGAQVLHDCGLHVGQETIFQALQESAPRTNAQIAAWAGCEPPTITNSVAKLESAGLVTRNRRKGDGRVVEVDLTGPGRELLPRLDQAWLELAEETVGGLDPEETEEIAVLLEQLADRLKAARARRAGERP